MHDCTKSVQTEVRVQIIIKLNCRRGKGKSEEQEAK
jgi:hypothetical protein